MTFFRSLARTIFGVEVFIEPAPQFGFFELDRIAHGPNDWELWAMGRHVVVSRV